MNYNVNSSALGDSIVCIPAIISHSKNCPDVGIKNKYSDLLCRVIPNSHPLPLKESGEGFTIYQKDYMSPEVGRWIMNNNLPDYASIRLGQPIGLSFPTIVPPNVRKFHRYVCISAAHSDLVRYIPDDVIDEIVRYVAHKRLIPVLVGKSNKDKNYHYKGKSKCLNWIDKLSLDETLVLLGNCKALITPDSGLLWMCALLSTQVICIYQNVPPWARMPVRNNVAGWGIYPVLPTCDCKYCATTLTSFQMQAKCLKYDWEIFEGIKGIKKPDILPCHENLFERIKIKLDEII